MDRQLSHQPNKATRRTNSDGSDLREKRERLVKLLGRLLARHWLRRQPESEGHYSTSRERSRSPVLSSIPEACLATNRGCPHNPRTNLRFTKTVLIHANECRHDTL
jgi:hypothetical protein